MKTKIIDGKLYVEKGKTEALFMDVSESGWCEDVILIMDGVEYKPKTNLRMGWIDMQIRRLYTEEELLEFIINNFS